MTILARVYIPDDGYERNKYVLAGFIRDERKCCI
jgi:hypothetical protein